MERQHGAFAGQQRPQKVEAKQTRHDVAAEVEMQDSGGKTYHSANDPERRFWVEDIVVVGAPVTGEVDDAAADSEPANVIAYRDDVALDASMRRRKHAELENAARV